MCDRSAKPVREGSWRAAGEARLVEASFYLRSFMVLRGLSWLN